MMRMEPPWLLVHLALCPLLTSFQVVCLLWLLARCDSHLLRALSLLTQIGSTPCTAQLLLLAGGLFRLLDFAALPHTLALPARRLMDSLTSQSALHAALGSSRRRAFHAELQRLVDAHFVPQQAQQAQQLAAVGGSGAAVQVRGSNLRSSLSGNPTPAAAALSDLWFISLTPSAPPQLRRLQVAPSADTVQGRQWVELPLLTKAYLLAKSAGPAPSHQCGCGSARVAAAPFAPEHHCLFCGRTINED